MNKGKRKDRRKSRGRRGTDSIASHATIYAAYLVLIMRLLALLTTQLHLEPAAPDHMSAAVQRLDSAAVAEWPYVASD